MAFFAPKKGIIGSSSLTDLISPFGLYDLPLKKGFGPNGVTIHSCHGLVGIRAFSPSKDEE